MGQQSGHALTKSGQPFFLGHLPAGRGHNLVGGHMVGALVGAAAAQQTLGQIMDQFLFGKDLAIHHGLGQGNFTPGHTAFQIFGFEYGTCGPAGTALDTGLAPLPELFKIFHFTAPVSSGKILPGLRILWGSNAFFRVFMYKMDWFDNSRER